MLALTCRFTTAAPRTTATIRPRGQKTRRWRVLWTAWLVNASGPGLQESSLVLCLALLPPLKARPLPLPWSSLCLPRLCLLSLLLLPLALPLSLPLPLPLSLPLLLSTLRPLRTRKSPSRATTIISASPTALGPSSPVAVRHQEQDRAWGRRRRRR